MDKIKVAATENKKRGRPDVFSSYYGESANTYRGIVRQCLDIGTDTPRAMANRQYVLSGLELAEQAGMEHFCTRKEFRPQVLEQIGRMYLQNGYSREACYKVLKICGDAYATGTTVKAIVKYIRNGRMTGEW